MELLGKVRNKYAKNHVNYLSGWKDGQPIDIRHDGYYTGKLTRKCHCVIQLSPDYWDLRGTTNSREDWKSTIGKVYELKKWLVASDSLGKYAWEVGYRDDGIRKRDWFFDYKDWLDKGWITQAQFDSIYNPAIDHLPIYFDRALTELLLDEETKARKQSIYSNLVNSDDFISTGTFSIGNTLDFDDVTDFEAAIDATLTGNLTGEHNDEETAISSAIRFDTDTATFLLKLTAQSGDEHDGDGTNTFTTGNGARINFGTNDAFNIWESTDGHLDDVEISNLALDISGTGNKGVHAFDGGNSGEITFKRLLIKGDTNATIGIEFSDGCLNGKATNNIVYGVGNGAGDGGLVVNAFSSGRTIIIYNNTCIKNYDNFVQETGGNDGTLIFKNNLAQGDTGGSDYRDDGATFGTTGTNISEDATSPDASYRSKDLHTNTIFNDYANDDYKLDSGGDTTNLAIADDGEDLSGTFTDDIIGQTRSIWYIGASELVPTVTVPDDTLAPTMQMLNSGGMIGAINV